LPTARSSRGAITSSRVFQDVTAPEIVEHILQEHIAANPAIAAILKVQFNLRKQYPTRSYCLQYRETDLAFIERLLQFHWQRPKEHPEYGAKFDERSSCWVRVAYPSAGGAWGHQSLPRIG